MASRSYSFEEFERKLKAKIDKARANGRPQGEPSADDVPHEPEEDSLEFVPFPTDALPGPVGRFCEEVGGSVDCEPALVVLPALAVVAGAIGNTQLAHVKRDFDQPCVLWTAVIARSGSHKTVCFKAVLKYIAKVQRDHLKRYDQQFEQWKKDKDAGDAGDADRPVARRILTNNCTIESLIGVLAENPRGMIVARSELAGWVGGFSAYKKSSELDDWLEIYDGAGICVDRKTGEKKVTAVHAACVSVTGGFQPRRITHSFTDENLGAGFGSRFLTAHPPPRVVKWTDLEVSESTNYEWTRLLGGLLNLEFDHDPEGHDIPHVHHFGPDALAVFSPWYEAWHELAHYTRNDHLNAARIKNIGHVVRLALIDHVCANVEADPFSGGPGPRRIGAESVQRAIRMVEWFDRENQRLYGTDNVDHGLLDWIRARGGKVKPRDLQQGKKADHAADAKRQLGTLVHQKKGEWIKEGSVTFFSLFD